MRLGTKIFFYVTVFFSVAFLFGGYILLSYFYEVTMEREISSAVERYQYNKFVVEANLITRGQEWFEGAADGSYDIGNMVSDMNDPAALFSMDKEMLFSGFPAGMEFTELLVEISRDRIDYRFVRLNGRTYLLTGGIVEHKDTALYLVTGIDVQRVSEQQEQMIRKFGAVYGITVAIGAALIFGLSMVLTKSVKELTAATRKIADGSYKERVAYAGKDEVGQLARNFNKMAAAVEEKVQELSDGAKQKEDFVANFAHELKTPLTSVIGYADRIYQKELSREEQKKAAWHIWNEGMRLESLSLKLMEMTTLNHNDFIMEEMETDIVFHELTADMEYLMEKNDVSFTCDAEWAYIEVEYDLFKTLMLNLVDNSIKAGAEHIQVTGRIEENTKKALSGQDDRMYYKVQITDDGCGIPKQEIKRITEAFYMVDKSRSRKQHGAGIGLALAEKIAQIHQSTLLFESDGIHGTTVSMRLQCKGAEDDEEG